MKYFYLSILLLFLGAACDDNDSLPAVKPVDSGTCEIEGETYEWVQIGDQQWITSNLKAGERYYEIDVDLDQYGEYLRNYLDEDEEENFNKYGNLYEWETACEVCEELGDGWRLPTDEDWQKLEQALGMSAGEAASTEWRGDGVADLLRQGEEGTNLKLQVAGNCSFYGSPYALKLRYLHEKGFYWTASQREDGKVYYRKLHYNSSEVFREATDPRSVPMMRVRVCRDAQ